MASSQLKGKGAIVTGGGSGINLAFCKLLHQSGCSVLIADLALHREAVPWVESIQKDQSNDAQGPKVVFHKIDVTDWKQLEDVFNVYDREIGGIPYIVCPGAGIYEPSTNGFWNDKDEASHYKILDVNLVHPIKMTRIAVRKMLAAKAPGIIIHISSTGAQKSSIITPLYQASKHGISSFIRAMKPLMEMAGVRVVGVAPGPTFSPLFYDHPEANRFIDPAKDELTTPDEIGRGMLAVCLDSKYPAGTVLEVTGPGRWREVHMLNDPGPQGQGSWTSNKDEALADIKAFLEADKKGSS